MPERFSWVIEDALAGMERPGLFEPLDEDLLFLRDKGIDVIVNHDEIFSQSRREGSGGVNRLPCLRGLRHFHLNHEEPPSTALLVYGHLFDAAEADALFQKMKERRLRGDLLLLAAFRGSMLGQKIQKHRVATMGDALDDKARIAGFARHVAGVFAEWPAR